MTESERKNPIQRSDEGSDEYDVPINDRHSIHFEKDSTGRKIIHLAAVYDLQEVHRKMRTGARFGPALVARDGN